MMSAYAHAQQPEIGLFIVEMRDLTEQALDASRQAEQASSIGEIKRLADTVYEAVWGLSSGLVDEAARGAENVHGWKTRWQVTFSDFDSLFAERYGSLPPEITDPAQLGIVGRGRYVRLMLEDSTAAGYAIEAARIHGTHIVESLSNVIGWMKMDDGVTKGERQPRVDLTREWDSPIEFWMSTADTGWLFEAYAQAVNILKTDYEGDIDIARSHAAGMTALLQRALDGVDANGNGTVEPVKMEGGLKTAVQHAELGQWINSP